MKPLCVLPDNRPFMRSIYRLPVDSITKGQWQGTLMHSLLYNPQVNNKAAEGFDWQVTIWVWVMVLLIIWQGLRREMQYCWCQVSHPPMRARPTICLYTLYIWAIQKSDMQAIYMFIMVTSSNGNIFRVTGPLCEEFTGPGEFPTQRPVTRSFWCFLWSTSE